MTIRIEVTGNSLPEVADKLLALAGQFKATRVYDQGEVLNAPAAASKRKTKKVEPEVDAQEVDTQEDVGNGASSAEPTTEATPAASAEATTDGTTTSGAPAAAPEAPALDFDKEVAPVVIEAVQRVGKPAVSEVLSEFGVERASELDPSLYGELVDRLKAL